MRALKVSCSLAGDASALGQHGSCVAPLLHRHPSAIFGKWYELKARRNTEGLPAGIVWGCLCGPPPPLDRGSKSPIIASNNETEKFPSVCSLNQAMVQDVCMYVCVSERGRLRPRHDSNSLRVARWRRWHAMKANKSTRGPRTSVSLYCTHDSSYYAPT